MGAAFQRRPLHRAAADWTVDREAHGRQRHLLEVRSGERRRAVVLRLVWGVPRVVGPEGRGRWGEPGRDHARNAGGTRAVASAARPRCRPGLARLTVSAQSRVLEQCTGRSDRVRRRARRPRSVAIDHAGPAGRGPAAPRFAGAARSASSEGAGSTGRGVRLGQPVGLDRGDGRGVRCRRDDRLPVLRSGEPDRPELLSLVRGTPPTEARRARRSQKAASRRLAGRWSGRPVSARSAPPLVRHHHRRIVSA